MVVEIDTSKEYTLDWQAKGIDRIVQNVRNLISTFRYEVGYDRTKGLDPTLIEKPYDDAVALFISEVYRLVDTYEPNATVESVTPIGVDEEGNINFKVVINI